MGASENEGNKKTPIIGMRTVKTALAVFVCLVLYQLGDRFGYTTRFDAFLACVAAIICMQDSVEKSVASGYNRLYGTGLGALLGLIFRYIDVFFNNTYLVLALTAIGIVGIITLCNLLNINNSIIIGCVVFLVIVTEQTAEAPLFHSIRRLLDTIIGVLISIGVNHFIHNPDTKAKALAETKDAAEEKDDR
jgi:uncharacterized membrane protein YgaE (UPF0421/DUF939 family)